MTMEGDIHLPLIVCRPRKHLARPIHNTPFRSNTRSNHSYLVKERKLGPFSMQISFPALQPLLFLASNEIVRTVQVVKVRAAGKKGKKWEKNVKQKLQIQS